MMPTVQLPYRATLWAVQSAPHALNEVRYRSAVTHGPYTHGETSSAETGIAPQTEISIEDFEVLKISGLCLVWKGKVS